MHDVMPDVHVCCLHSVGVACDAEITCPIYDRDSCWSGKRMHLGIKLSVAGHELRPYNWMDSFPYHETVINNRQKMIAAIKTHLREVHSIPDEVVSLASNDLSVDV